MALSPGGFAIMLLMPVVGFLLSGMMPRKMMVFGLLVLSFSLFHMTRYDLNVDFSTIVWRESFQAAGMAFLFVPINTAAYAFPAARQEQRRFRPDESGPQHWRQRRDFRRHDDIRAAYPEAHQRSRGQPERCESFLAGYASGSGRSHAGGRDGASAAEAFSQSRLMRWFKVQCSAKRLCCLILIAFGSWVWPFCV